MRIPFLRRRSASAGVAGATTADLTGVRILLADDDEANRFAVQLILRRAGASVVTAGDGAEAVARVRQGEFDLVLMDLMMPVMDGYAATRAIRDELGRSPDVLPIAAMTASGTVDEHRRVAEAGMAGLILKPYQPESLLRQVAAIARHRGKGRLPSARDADAPAPSSEEAWGRGDAGMVQFADRFLEMRREDIRRIAECLAASDFGAIASIAHKVKGTGAIFGFPEIGEIGRRMEAAALERASGDVALLAEELREQLEARER